VIGDLLKDMRSSQIFSVCGHPEIALRKVAKRARPTRSVGRSNCSDWIVFDPITTETREL
jgi:adenine-specific DNA-methyltransferase